MRRSLGEDKVICAVDIVWSVAMAEWCIVADAVAHTGLPQRTDSEMLDIQSSARAVVSAHDIASDAEGNRELPDIPPSGFIEVR